MSTTVPYLRVVVTTRCPLKCAYCHMEGDPGEGELDRADLVALLRVGIANGVRKLKFLGGEPLARADLPEIVAAIVTRDLDVSVISSGVALPSRFEALFDAGLTRANLSVHGWSREAFALRGGTVRGFDLRAASIEAVLKRGRPVKLNYVYGGCADDADLDALLEWAAGRPLVVNVLDDLTSAVGCEGVLSAVRRLRGHETTIRVEPDPHSTPTLRLTWTDGLEVEVKHKRLGETAPWLACISCTRRSRCGEGIHAIRLGHDGVLRPCMGRPDLGLPLLPILRDHGEQAAAAAWRCFVAGALA